MKRQKVLIEKYISDNDPKIEGVNNARLVEITGGLLTKRTKKGILYTMFEPSQTLKTSDILSLEEKFLAGEGQNITPVVYSKNAVLNNEISNKVKSQLLNVARLLNIEGYARIDAFVRIPVNDINLSEEEEDIRETSFILSNIDIIIIEINTLPAMTPATCIFHQAAIAGYKPLDFIKAIIEYGVVTFDNKFFFVNS